MGLSTDQTAGRPEVDRTGWDDTIPESDGNSGNRSGMPLTFSHTPVLLQECMEALSLRPDGFYVDGTAGGGGHSFEILKRLTAMPGCTGGLMAIDQDEAAVEAASARLRMFGDRARVVRGNFCEVSQLCEEQGISRIDGLLLDLGVSSYQLDTPKRGFSYMADAPLDMRMDTRKTKNAYEVVNTYSESDLKRILWEYGEERFAGRIAAHIVRAREKHPISTTGELSALICSSVPAENRTGGHHPAKRSFQAIRIEVNAELDVIRPALEAALERMNPHGRLAVITFHSLEDRIVKQTFADMAQGCICPKDFPVCVCGRKPKVKLVTKKPILPGEEERKSNPRSHSAKLRVAEKL